MKDHLIGKRLVDIRPMTKDEIDDQCWPDKFYNKPIALEFEDGTTIFAARDGEINGPGVFFGTTSDHKSFRIQRVYCPHCQKDKVVRIS